MLKNTKNNSQDQKNQSTHTSQQDASQGVPLTDKEKELAQVLEQQIQSFEQKLEKKSNSELKDMSIDLESVERATLLEKIDNELHTIKGAIVKPGDAATTDAAGATAAVAVAANSSPE